MVYRHFFSQAVLVIFVLACVLPTKIALSQCHPPDFKIDGNSQVCVPFTPIIYSVNVQADLHWSVEGGNIVDGQSTQTIKIDWQRQGIGIIKLKAVFNCNGESITINKQLTVNKTEMPLALTQHDTTIQSTTHALSAQQVDRAQYLWTSGGSATIHQPNNAYTQVSNLEQGDNLFKFTVKRGLCEASDWILITVNSLLDSNKTIRLERIELPQEFVNTAHYKEAFKIEPEINNDNSNDTLIIKPLIECPDCYPCYKIAIYRLNGTIVYKNDPRINDCNGMIDIGNLEAGIYVYRLQLNPNEVEIRSFFEVVNQ